MENYIRADGTTCLTLSAAETNKVADFPRVGLYALTCRQGMVESGQRLNDKHVNVAQNPRSWPDGTKLLLAWFDGLCFVPETKGRIDPE